MSAQLDYEQVIDTCEWESYVPEHANEGGYTYSRVKRRKTVREVGDELKQALGVDQWGYCSHAGVEEYLSLGDGDREWPDGRIIVYAVNGTSEGDYVHVEVQPTDGGDRVGMILGKTFQGRDAAWAAAREVADRLGA